MSTYISDILFPGEVLYQNSAGELIDSTSLVPGEYSIVRLEQIGTITVVEVNTDPVDPPTDPVDPPTDPVDPPTDPVDPVIQDVIQEGVTPEQIALYAPISGELSQDVVARVEYSVSGSDIWSEGLSLWRIQPQWSGKQDAFAGVIYDLEIGTTYDIRVTFDDGSTQDVRNLIGHTRDLPPARGETTIQVSNEIELQDAMHSAVPGDVIEIINDITLDVGALWSNQSGTEEAPITLCGSGRDNVKLILSHSGEAIRPRSMDWWVFEDFTLQGPGVDGISGENGYSTAVQFWSGATPEGCCFRRLRIDGFDRGIITDNVLTSTLVYDCILEGNNSWDLEHAGVNITWNDDGIRLAGVGNCAFNNDLTGFGDSLALKGGIPDQRSIYFYRNKIRNSCDDAAELEYGTRNYAFYDNHITNSGTGVSFDGVYGGPLDIFRNRFINNVRGIIKCGAVTSGVRILSNTFVSTTGTKNGFGFYFSSARLRGWEYRNNLFLWEGTDEVLWMDGGACSAAIEQWKCDHNGWGRNGQVFHYVCGPTGDLATVQSALAPIHEHDIDLSGQAMVFDQPVQLGADYLTEITDYHSLELSDISEALGAGVVIPGIKTHADLGAIGYGETPPVVGNRHDPVVEPPIDPPVEPPTDPAITGPLVDMAASLAPGEWAAFPAGEVPDSMIDAADLAWQAHWHFDPTRNECSLLGDSPGGGEDNSLIHARYDIESNAWTLVGRDIFPFKQGHVYGNNADDGKGNIFFKPYNSAEIAHYNREADSWDLDTTISPNDGFSAGPKTSVGGGGAYHPNIGNAGGLIYQGRTRMYAYDIETRIWSVIHEITAFDPSYGLAVYVPALDKVIIGKDRLYSVDADLNVVDLGVPPLTPYAGSVSYGGSPVSMMLHPSNDSMIVLIEKGGGAESSLNGDVYTSTDGMTWTHQGDGNPFLYVGRQGSTVCSIPALGVLWAMGKASPDGVADSVVWKPNF